MASWELRQATGNRAYELYMLFDEVNASNSGNGSTEVRGRIGFIKVGSSGGYATHDDTVYWDFYIDGVKYAGTSSLNFGANDGIGTRRELGAAARWIGHNSDGTRVVHVGGGGANTSTSIGYPSRAGINVTLTPRTRDASAPSISFVSSTYNSITVNVGGASDHGLGTGAIQYNIDVSTASDFSNNVGVGNADTGSEVISGLAPDTRYYLRSAIRGRNGVWVHSGTITATTPNGLPTAPSSSAISGITASSMVLNWSGAAATGGAAIQDYQVQRATNSSFSGASSWDVSASTGSQTHTGLSRTTTYYFRVRARSAAGGGPWTSTVSATTLPELPGAPTLSSVSAIAPTTARVLWTAPSDDGGATITGYQIQRATDSSFSAGTAVYGDTESPLDATGVPTGSTIYWRVRAENSQGYGSWSNVVSAYQGAAPDAPAAPTVTPSADGTQATIAWTAPADNGWPITGYRIRRHDPAAGAFIQTYNANASPLVVTGLTPGVTYRWSVAAINEVGPGAYSAMTTAAQPCPPGAPNFTNLTVVDGDTAQITFSAPADDGGSPITGYQIEYSTSSSFATVTAVPVAAPGVHTVDGLTAGTRYYWRIRAINAAGLSQPSAARNALQDEPPGVPQDFKVVPGESGLNATASWVPPLPNGGSSVVNYTLRRYSSTGDFQQEYTTSQTSFFVSGLVAGTRYRWDVRANNVMGPGPATAQVSVLQPTPSISAGEYFDGDTPDTPEVTYAWTGTADLSESTATVAAPLGWYWEAAAGTHAAVLWRSRDTSVSGTYSAAVTFLRDSIGSGFLVGPGHSTESAIVVPEDADITGSMYVRAPRKQRVALSMQFYAQDGSTLGVSSGPSVILPGEEWVRLTHTFRSPFGAARAILRVRDANGEGWSAYKAGETFYFDAAMVTLGTSLYPYFDGSTPDTEQFLYSWEGAAHNSESRRDSLAVVSEKVDPLQDPDCPPFPTPPRPPSIDPSCVTEVDRWRRYWVQVPPSMIPDAMVTVPILTLRTYQSSINQVHIRFYEDPDGAGETGVSPAQYVSDQIISYLPANSVLTLDSMQERAYATVGGGNSVAADHLVYGEGGTPPVWPRMDCGIGYMIALDVPSALPVGAVEMKVRFARRMR